MLTGIQSISLQQGLRRCKLAFQQYSLRVFPRYSYPRYAITNLSDLIRELQAHIIWQKKTCDRIDMERALPILQLYTGVDRTEHITFSAQHYTRFRIPLPRCVTDFDMYLIGRDYAQMSDIHDHADNGCIFTVLQGTLVERRYSVDMSVAFTLEKETLLRMGAATYISDDIGYHALGTTDHEVRGVSLHIYSPAKYSTNYRNIER